MPASEVVGRWMNFLKSKTRVYIMQRSVKCTNNNPVWKLGGRKLAEEIFIMFGFCEMFLN